MNRKVLILALSLLVLTSIVSVASVRADPTSGQKVPVTQITGGVISVTPGTFWITNGNVTQRRDFEQVIGTTLIIDGEAPITGLSYNTLDATWVNGGTMRIGHWDAVWYFPSVNGGFEGNINNLFTDYDLGPPATYNLKVHTLLHGFGSFEGSTLQLSYDGPAGGDWTGYLLKP